MTRCPEGHFYDPARHTECPWCALPADSGPVAQKTRPLAEDEQNTRRIAIPDQRTRPMPAGGLAAAPPIPPPLPGGARRDLASNPPPLPAPPVGARGPAAAAPAIAHPHAAAAPALAHPPAIAPAPTVPPANFAPTNATVRVGAGARAGLKEGPVVGWLVCLEGPDRGRDYRLHMEKNFIGRAQHMDIVIENDSTVSRDKHAIVIFDPKKKTFWALPGEASGLVYLNGDIVNSPSQMKPDDILEVGQTKLVLIPFCGERYSWSSDSAAVPQSEVSD